MDRASREPAPLPAMHANLALVCREKVAHLREALHGPDSSEALEAVRELIELFNIHPPRNDGDPPRTEIIGEFITMFQASGLGANTRDRQAQNTNLLHLFVGSVKVDIGAWTRLYRTYTTEAYSTRAGMPGAVSQKGG